MVKEGDYVSSGRLIIAGSLGALSTILGEAVSRVLVYMKIGQLDLFQFHSLFLTIDEPSFILGLIVSFIIGSIVAVIVCNHQEKHSSDGVLINSIVATVYVWFF
jgi:hypothetical protein